MDLKKYQIISHAKRNCCVVCGSEIKANIFLPKFPLTEIFIPEKITEDIGNLDQEFSYCTKCGHGQINNIIDSDVLYNSKYYNTRTSTSSSGSKSIDYFFEFIINMTKDRRFKSVIDIGCNDLYALNKFKKLSDELIGIDPILKNNKESDIKIFPDFIENIDFKKENISYDLVISSHTLEHIENPKKTLNKLIGNASDSTLFCFQFPGLESLVQNSRFDLIFHQHLNYFSLKSICYLLDEVGAEILAYDVNHNHWGSLMIAFRRKKSKREISNIDKFQNHFLEITPEIIRTKYNLFRTNFENTNKMISYLNHSKTVCFGASLMLPVLVYYLPSLRKINKLIDDDISKKGKYYLNLPHEIISSKEIDNLPKYSVIVTAITAKESMRAIISNLIRLNVKDIIVPIIFV